MYLSDFDIEEGRRLLRLLIPQAKSKAAKELGSYKAVSALGRAQLPYLKLNNVKAVIIHRASQSEGWHSEVLLRAVPPAIANVLGSPVREPLESYSLAVEFAVNLLAMIINIEAEGVSERIPPTFVYHNFEITLHVNVLAMVEAFPSLEYAEHQLAKIEKQVFPHGVPEDRLSISDTHAPLIVALHKAAKSGLLSYPSSVPVFVRIITSE